MRRSGRKASSRAHSELGTLAAAHTLPQQLHRCRAVPALQLAQLAAAATAKALLADVMWKNPDASYTELLRRFKVRRSVADGHS